MHFYLLNESESTCSSFLTSELLKWTFLKNIHEVKSPRSPKSKSRLGSVLTYETSLIKQVTMGPIVKNGDSSMQGKELIMEKSLLVCRFQYNKRSIMSMEKMSEGRK